MSLAESAIDTFRQAAELNLQDPARTGSFLRFPNYGQVVMTGDLHGHRRNFEKIVAWCRLETTPVRHVMLHELIHPEPTGPGSLDTSVELLLDAAKWKTFFPEQVHFLQSNHELAQMVHHEITKGGRMVTQDFERGVAKVLGSKQLDKCLEAIEAFIASFPLAARTGNGVFLAHSLPDANAADFDPACVDKPAGAIDYSEGGSVYQLVWGRRHTPELLDRLAAYYDVKHFIIGHQPQEFGYTIEHGRLIILATDNNHGVFLPIDCSKKYDIAALEKRIVPCAGVDL